MTEYIFIGIAFLLVIILSVLFVRYVLNPLFFPRYFPKKEVLIYLKEKGLELVNHKKLKRKIFVEEFDSFEIKENSFYIKTLPFIYRISYFSIKTINEKGESKSLGIKFYKSNSFFYEDNIEFYLE